MEVFKAESAPAMGTTQGNDPSLNDTQQTLQELF